MIVSLHLHLQLWLVCMHVRTWEHMIVICCGSSGWHLLGHWCPQGRRYAHAREHPPSPAYVSNSPGVLIIVGVSGWFSHLRGSAVHTQSFFLCVYMWCVYVWMCVYMYIYVYIYILLLLTVCIYVCMGVFTYVCVAQAVVSGVYLCIYVRMVIVYVCICAHVCVLIFNVWGDYCSTGCKGEKVVVHVFYT